MGRRGSLDTRDFGRILDACCRKFRVEPEDVLAKNQSQQISKCRHVCAYLMRQAGMSYPKIADYLGRKNHSTVMHSVQFIEEHKVFFERALRDLEETINIEKRRASEDWWMAY